VVKDKESPAQPDKIKATLALKNKTLTVNRSPRNPNKSPVKTPDSCHKVQYFICIDSKEHNMDDSKCYRNQLLS
jgi:hypothetical protein